MLRGAACYGSAGLPFAASSASIAVLFLPAIGVVICPEVNVVYSPANTTPLGAGARPKYKLVSHVEIVPRFNVSCSTDVTVELTFTLLDEVNGEVAVAMEVAVQSVAGYT